ncbi:MAG: hypothetical protein FGM63_01605 [Candidatus Nanopelagicaceae bacterium]|nr:hypothetical protein [Candidatus Nanopelagicaceae bacterium]
MIANSNLTARALILASGPENPAADEIVKKALSEFVYELLELQRIDLGGRTILALLIAHDRAHSEAIRLDLEKKGPDKNLDIAMLEIAE